MGIVRLVIGSLLAVSALIFVAGIIPLYGLAVGDEVSAARVRPAAVVAWAGVVGSVLFAGREVLARVRAGLPIGWAPLLVVPVLAGSWVLGLLVAVALAP